MTVKRKAALGLGIAVAIAIVGAGVFSLRRKTPRLRSIVLTGVVITQDKDPRKQVPIINAAITAAVNGQTVSVSSDVSGLFRIHLPPERADTEQVVALSFRHSGYEPFEMTEVASDRIYIARMVPIPRETGPSNKGPEAVLGDLRLRYSEKAETSTNIGPVVRPFEVVNTGNIPCKNRQPCSPNGKWKASIGSLTLDAGAGNEFRNVRLSCIAGPCPFTKIQSENLSQGGANLTVSVLNWSDTTTYLLEAEATQTKITDVVRESFPATFGSTMNFTLPASAEGPSIEADLNGQEIVFPLGPDLILSWAVCSVKMTPDHTKLFRCDLKPGYRFR